MERHVAEKLTHANKRITIYYDSDDCVHPRKDWDNSTILAHWHTRYDLGDKRIDRMTSEELVAMCEDEGDKVLAILPLYLYDHSGLTMSTGAFSCQWDSGQVGWGYITQEKADMMGFPKEYTREMYEDIIKSEVQTYDAFLRGEVYGYEVEGMDGDTLESCWGYVGCKEDCISDAKSAAEGCEDPAVIRQAEELAGRATYAGVCEAPGEVSE